MIWTPMLGAAFFVGAQIVTGILAYRQGRKDEELDWQRRRRCQWCGTDLDKVQSGRLQ